MKIFKWQGSLLLAALAACARTVPIEPPAPSPAPMAVPRPAAAADGKLDAGTDAAEAVAVAWAPPAAAAIDGPHQELALDAGRPIYWALARDAGTPLRLVGHLHGMCGPPPYACGKWIGAGTDVGLMVCPTGNARCGDSPVGPPSWEAPTWMELVTLMDADLEASIAKVKSKVTAPIARDGAVLTGYSRGAFAAPVIARAHPGRWPYLVLIEANAPINAASLGASGVKAVALVAGEQGTEIAGMKKTEAELERAHFPAKLFVMRRTGHLYSDDMEYVMHEALSFVLSQSGAGRP